MLYTYPSTCHNRAIKRHARDTSSHSPALDLPRSPQHGNTSFTFTFPFTGTIGTTPSSFNNKLFVFGGLGGATSSSSGGQLPKGPTIPLISDTTTLDQQPQPNSDMHHDTLHFNKFTSFSNFATNHDTLPSSSTQRVVSIPMAHLSNDSSTLYSGPPTDHTLTNLSSTTNVFLFSTVLDHLEKIPPSSSNQMGAALMTPWHRQIVTSFRIDSILPSTRYTELPEQARLELDELDHYIYVASLRSDYIIHQATPIQQHIMDNIRHQRDMIHCKMDALSSGLQCQVSSVEGLLDSLKNQVKYISHAHVVIESGGSARQQYGDDYFFNLSTRHAFCLANIKKTINDIETTIDCWIKNQLKSPQDVASVIKLQNQIFLTLAHQAATLHERLDMEQLRYTQYRLESFTL
ncbi:hypothetical protein BC941DRAFT_469765 [Chlamydoabsidia padenii]|nr:hypothetical protein BC941DRAFT_469765 [Chlamydoabsidia padenii]